MKSKFFLWLSIFLLAGACGKDSDDPAGEKTNNEEPTVSFQKPTNQQEVLKGSEQAITVNASDTDGSIAWIKLYIDNMLHASSENGQLQTVWNTNDDEWQPGDHQLTAIACDNSNSEVTASITVKIIEQYSVSGILKDRDSGTALEGTTMTLTGETATTSETGAFSIRSTQTGNQALTSPGSDSFLPIQYAWDFEANNDYQFDLFSYGVPGDAATKPNDFIKGVSMFDAGPWLGQELYPDAFYSTFDRLETMHTNLVTVFDPVFVTVAGMDSVKMGTAANSEYSWNMITEDQYNNLTSSASQRNMNIMYWLGVWPQDEEQLDGKSFNAIVFSGQKLSDKFWDDWFSEYERILIPYAQNAEANQVPWISLGHGLSYATSPSNFESTAAYEQYWTGLISAIRNVYNGKLVYFGTARPFTTTNYEGGTETKYFEDEGYTTSFLNLFDAVGVILSNITEIENPSVAAIEDATSQFLDHYSPIGKPVLLWVWAPSVDGAANHYGHLEPILDVSSAANSFETDYYEQADIYEGILQAVNSTSVEMAGIISHGFMYYDRLTLYEPRQMNTAFQKSASVRGKPAEEIIKYWFGAW
jgi:hypothetical protein